MLKQTVVQESKTPLLKHQTPKGWPWVSDPQPLGLGGQKPRLWLSFPNYHKFLSDFLCNVWAWGCLSVNGILINQRQKRAVMFLNYFQFLLIRDLPDKQQTWRQGECRNGSERHWRELRKEKLIWEQYSLSWRILLEFLSFSSPPPVVWDGLMIFCLPRGPPWWYDGDFSSPPAECPCVCLCVPAECPCVCSFQIVTTPCLVRQQYLLWAIRPTKTFITFSALSQICVKIAAQHTHIKLWMLPTD